jgi:hypothetical protein
MYMPCAACAGYPTGVEGHADLRVRTLGAARLSFECRGCGLFWVRTKSSKPGFTWNPASESVACSPNLGVAVPPRAGQVPRLPLAFRGWGEPSARSRGKPESQH